MLQAVFADSTGADKRGLLYAEQKLEKEIPWFWKNYNFYFKKPERSAFTRFIKKIIDNDPDVSCPIANGIPPLLGSYKVTKRHRVYVPCTYRTGIDCNTQNPCSNDQDNNQQTTSQSFGASGSSGGSGSSDTQTPPVKPTSQQIARARPRSLSSPLPSQTHHDPSHSRRLSDTAIHDSKIASPVSSDLRHVAFSRSGPSSSRPASSAQNSPSKHEGEHSYGLPELFYEVDGYDTTPITF